MIRIRNTGSVRGIGGEGKGGSRIRVNEGDDDGEGRLSVKEGGSTGQGPGEGLGRASVRGWRIPAA